jgi:hypothetical protein
VRPVKPIKLLKSINGPSSAATTENPGLVPQRGPNYTLIVLLWQIHCLQLQVIMRLQPGSQEKFFLSRTQSHKGIVASENLVKFVLCTKFVFV